MDERLFVIVETSWGYNDEWYYAESGTTNRKAYTDRAKANAEALRLNREFLRQNSLGDYLGECNSLTDSFSDEELDAMGITNYEECDVHVPSSISDEDANKIIASLNDTFFSVESITLSK